MKRLVILQPASASGAEVTSGRLSESWLRLARIGWVTTAIMVVIVLIASSPSYVAKFGGQLQHATGGDLPPGSHFFAAASAVASLVSALITIALSLLLFRRKFREPIAALLSFILLLYGIVMSGPLEFASAYWLGSADWAFTAQSVLLVTPMIALLMLYPSGQFVPDWTRWVVLISVPFSFWMLLIAPFDGVNVSRDPQFATAVGALFLAFCVSGIYAQIFRYRRRSTNTERKQIRWALYGFALWIAYMLFSSVPYFYLTGLPPGAPTPWWAPASELGWWLSLNIFPVCLTIAITRHHLWDIDLIINRTIVYGALSTVVIALYILVVGALSTIFQAGGNLLVTLTATGLVAILFQPLRERLQRAVNRLLYGNRDEPFEVLARLGERLEATLAPEMVYPTIVETVAQTLKLPYAAIAVRQGEQLVTAETYGRPRSDLVAFPLSYQGSLVGELLVERRAPNEAFSDADKRLLRNIARQAGAAVHAVQLTADLQRSRQQLVTAREEERRRLRRDLHDGLGPHLASQTLTIDAIGKLLARDPQRAQALLQDLKAQSMAAVQDIRRLVYNLRPPALDELGLLGALQESAARQSQNGLSISVEAASSLPPLPAAIEVAAFRIAQEAMNNTVRHAEAQTCTVRLALKTKHKTPGEPQALQVEVVDDGQGFAPDGRPGVGLHSMRERAEELGGDCQIESAAGAGTHVSALLPLPAPQDAP
ncbi:MAG: histidine kinase [Chloroflexota bacterium]